MPRFGSGKTEKIGSAGRKSEKQLAKKIGATLTPASGAMASAKGDMQFKDNLLEAKSTKNKSLSLKKSYLDKIKKEALEQNKNPALVITFTDDTGTNKDTWVAIPLYLYTDLINATQSQ